MSKRFKVRASSLKFSVDEREYAWFGGFGAVFLSLERGVKKGDIRSIGNVLFVAWQVRPASPYMITRKRLISWSPVEEWNAQDIRLFRSAIFGTNDDAEATGGEG